jgi:adenylate cyclase
VVWAFRDSFGKHLAESRWLLFAIAFMLVAISDYRWFGATRIIDQRAGDILLAAEAARRPASDRVVILNIDQRSLEEMNDLAGSWPWPRSVHGELIDHIERQRPRAIVFDTLFNELDVYRPEHDAAFADVVARNGNVWLAMTLNADGQGGWIHDMPKTVGMRPLTNPPVDVRVPIMLPLAVAQQPNAMRGGLINFIGDSDTVGRHHALYLDRSGWRFPSLAARVMEALGRPLPKQENVLLNWRRDWKQISYSDVYLDGLRQRPLRPQDEFKGKIVIIGTTAPGLHDLRLTPLSSTYPGAEVLATAIDNLDRGDWLREIPRTAMILLILILVASIALGLSRKSSANRLGYGLLGISIVIVAVAWWALVNGTFVPVFAPLALGWIFYLGTSAIAYLEERAQRLRTSDMFKRFLDPRVVTSLIERGEIDYRNNAEAREVTVLFSDIRGFTALSEVSRPEDVVAMLNGYFSRQVEVIFTHGGTLDKFMGDAIMAFWGAPVSQADHARLAVTAALEMSAALADLRGQLGSLGAALEIGIGIHTGRAVAGFIGSKDRLDYTVIGDTVNLATRIEGVTKGIARILVSETTRDAIGDSFDWRDRGFHHVKGREQPVRLFEPLLKADSLTD